jgi:hypothetical protein
LAAEALMATENGWEPSHAGPDILEWRTVPGTNPPVRLQVMKGWPSAVMIAYAADYNAYIEPLRDADSASFTPTNSVATSNHLNGTAMDLNWNDHPFRVNYAGFDDAKIQRMRDLLAFYNFEGVQIMFWAQDWNSPKDAMHHQMGYNTWNNPKVGRFIAERIRPDGFSTYKRSGTPPPPPPVSKQDQYALAVMGEGRRRGITARGIQIAFATVFVESNWKMYANSSVPESMSIPHDAVGSDHDSVGLFQQRCPMWGPANVLMNPALSAGLFFDRLVKLDYNSPAHSPGYYAQAVQRSAFPDRYDQRSGDASALYNRLANTPPEEGFLMALSDQQQRELYDAVCGQRPSKSPLRPLAAGGNNIGNLRDVVGYIDGSAHWAAVKAAAELGHPTYLALLRDVAGADPNQYPDRQDDAKLAQAILADIEAKTQVVGESYSAPATPQIVYVDRPAPAVAQPVALTETNGVEAKSTGQIIGAAYDALQQLRLADALPIEERAPLAALISVLSTKNGAAL